MLYRSASVLHCSAQNLLIDLLPTKWPHSTSLANITLLAINPGVSQRTKRVEDQTTIPEIPEFGSTSQIPDLWLAEGIFPAP